MPSTPKVVKVTPAMRFVSILLTTYLDAIDKVDEMYKNEEIVLDHSNYIDHEIEEPVGCAIARQALNRRV